MMNLEEARRKYKMWSDCEDSIATGGKSYSIGGRTFTRADLPEVRNQMNYWASEIKTLTGGRRSKTFIYRDDV